MRMSSTVRQTLLALPAMTLATVAMAGDVEFTERIVTTGADGAAAVFAADLDGDGDLDLIAASSGDDTVAWYENDGGAPPSMTEHLISTTAERAFDVFAADVDGDGDVDVLAASADDDTIAWYENDGGAPPSFFEHVVTDQARFARAVAAADLDGDGDMDLLAASSGDGVVAWYENDGADPPAFTYWTIAPNAPGARDVLAADMDGDGDLDVVAAASFGLDTITWFENDGQYPPTFTDHIVSVDPVGLTAIAAADMDGDGDMDLLSSSGFDDTIAWYENDGAAIPGFTRGVVTSNAAFARAVAAADLDDDGLMDVLSASSADDKIAWYRNDGGSPPAFVEFELSTSADGAAAVLAADIDGDGALDVLAASGSDDTVAWFESGLEPAAGPSCRGDLDNDGEVGFGDLFQLLTTWGMCPPLGNCPGDLDATGHVTGRDLSILVRLWGPCPEPGGASPQHTNRRGGASSLKRNP